MNGIAPPLPLQVKGVVNSSYWLPALTTYMGMNVLTQVCNALSLSAGVSGIMQASRKTICYGLRYIIMSRSLFGPEFEGRPSSSWIVECPLAAENRSLHWKLRFKENVQRPIKLRTCCCRPCALWHFAISLRSSSASVITLGQDTKRSLEFCLISFVDTMDSFSEPRACCSHQSAREAGPNSEGGTDRYQYQLL